MNGYWKVVKTDEALQRLRDGGKARPKGMYGYLEAYREHLKRYNNNGIPVINYIPTINMFFSDKDWEIWVEPTDKERLDQAYNRISDIMISCMPEFKRAVEYWFKDWYQREEQIRGEK